MPLSTLAPLLSLRVERCHVAHCFDQLIVQLLTLETAYMKKLLAVLVAGLFAAGAFAQAPATAPASSAPMASPAPTKAKTAKVHKKKASKKVHKKKAAHKTM